MSRFVLVLLVLAVLATPAATQTTNGVITGLITDAQGSVLPGVTVTVRNTETGLVRSLVTEGDGRYRIGALPPGPYGVQAELQGFASVTVTDVIITVGSEAVRNLTMQVQGVQESVTVTGEAPIVDTAKTEVSGVITQQQMDMLPLATRQPMDLALLLPGTSQDAVRARKSNSNIGAGAFTMGSALLVDGVWNKEGNTGEPRQDFPQSAVREFKVFVSQSPAEYGWTAGGAVTFATKSGTNLFSGEGFEYLRTKALNQRDPFAKANGSAKPDFRRQQMGAAVGGPLVKNRLHVFQAVEQTLIDQAQTVIVSIPQYYGNMNGNFDVPEYNRMTFTRIDVQINQRQSLFGRFAWQDSDFQCEGCTGSTNQPYFRGSGTEQKRFSWMSSHSWVSASGRILNEARGQWTNYHNRVHPPGVKAISRIDDLSPKRTAPLTPTYSFPSLSWGSNAAGYTDQLSRELKDDLTVTRGTHSWKFGGGRQALPIWNHGVPNPGAWTFSADQPFNPSNLSAFVPVAGTVRMFTATLLQFPKRFSPNVLWHTYAQDEWRPVSNVTLTLGLRYEYQTGVFHEGFDINDATYFPTTGTATDLRTTGVDFSRRGDKNNIGPRAGLAWDLGGGKTVVRLGYGLYYNTMSLLATGGELTNLQQLNVNLTNPSYPDPYQGRDPVTFVSAQAQNIATIANDLENLESRAYTAGLSRELTSTLGVHVDGVYNKMTKVPTAVDINMRPGSYSFATKAFVASSSRPLSQFAKISQTQSIGWIDYKALLVRLEKRFDRRYMYLISYTLSKSYGNVASGGVTSTMTQAEAPLLEVGPTNSDRRHVLVGSGSVLVPGDVQLGAVFAYRSAMPFSATAGIDINGDANNTDYVPATTRTAFNRGRNEALLAAVNAWRAGQGPDALHPTGLPPIVASQIDTNEFYSLDVRATKSLQVRRAQRIEVIAQVFNVLGRKNLVAVPGGNTLPSAWITNALSDQFGRILNAGNMRQAEVAVRYVW